MNSLEIVTACVPFSIYLLVIALIPLRRRPFVLSGGNDTFFLLLGLSGFFLVGPVKMFLPMGALIVWGYRAYLLVGLLYVLCAMMICGMSRQRIIIYNIPHQDFIDFFRLCFPVEDPEQFAQEQKNLEIPQKLFGAEARSLGNAVSIPRFDIQFSVDVQPRNRCVVLKSTNRVINLPGWFLCENALKSFFHTHKTPLSFGRCVFLLLALAFAAAVSSYTLTHLSQISQELALFRS